MTGTEANASEDYLKRRLPESSEASGEEPPSKLHKTESENKNGLSFSKSKIEEEPQENPEEDVALETAKTENLLASAVKTEELEPTAEVDSLDHDKTIIPGKYGGVQVVGAEPSHPADSNTDERNGQNLNVTDSARAGSVGESASEGGIRGKSVAVYSKVEASSSTATSQPVSASIAYTGTTTPSFAASSFNSPAVAPSGVPPGVPTGQLPAVSHPDAIVEERGEVSALYVGRVIGKGGEMIRDLQARAGCRIDVDQNVPPGQPRVITYRGNRSKVDFAKKLVHMLCQENASEADLPLGGARREFLVVPAQAVGKIIGRGGEMIRELQSRSQAKIQVDHSGHSGLANSEKQVTITGTDQAVLKAKEMVLFLVANPMMDAMQSINMLIEDKLHRGGVWGSGPPYPNLPNQGQNMQPNDGGSYGFDQQQYFGGGVGHGAPSLYAAQAPPQYSAPVAPYAAVPPAYQQQAAQASFAQYGGVEFEIFYAAKNFMGRIIGQKGVTINDLQRRSACDIQINQDVPPGQDCEISIRGSRQGIEMVKQMLREIIEIGPNHPYAGGQGAQAGYQQVGYGQQVPQYGYQQPVDYGQVYGQPYGQGYGQQGYPAPAASYAPQQAVPYQSPAVAYGAPPQVSDWKSATSPEGQVYYYNERTGETQWEKPVGMP